MNEFKRYHPIVNFIYFLFVIGFAMFFMNPVCLIISFVCGFSYSVILGGKKAFKTNLLYMLPMMLAAALINPAFNHEGVTIIEYLPGGNPLTLESIIFGLFAAVMIVSVICWFSCFNAVLTSDKIIYLFGRIIPSLSLIFSMTLRFVPKFATQLKKVSDAQKCIGQDISGGGVIKRIRNGLSILSIMITWALESSIETADSMKSRGYGLRGRTAFSVFKFNKRDITVLGVILILGVYILVGNFFGVIDFRFFPSIGGAEASALGMSVFFAYFMLAILPVIIEVREALRWKSLKQKI